MPDRAIVNESIGIISEHILLTFYANGLNQYNIVREEVVDSLFYTRFAIGELSPGVPVVTQ